MSTFSRTLRILASVAIALPLGQGGVCCCVLGGPEHPAAAARVHAAAPAHSCCTPTGPAAPSAPTGSGDDEHPCGCPPREDAVLTAGSVDSAVSASLSDAGLLALVSFPSALASVFSTVACGTDGPSHVPKLLSFRAPCVLRC